MKSCSVNCFTFWVSYRKGLRESITSEFAWDPNSNFLQLGQLPKAGTNRKLQMLEDYIYTHNYVNILTPEFPKILRGILQLEMFKQRLNQR